MTSDGKRYAEAESKAPMKAGDLPGNSPFEGEQIKAADLIGKSFLIIRVRRMTSTKGKKGGPDHFYLVQAKMLESGQVFSTLLGGVAVVQVIDAWTEVVNRGPLQVTLEQIEGGEFGKYYVLS